jgi:hypothetical protein
MRQGCRGGLGVRQKKAEAQDKRRQAHTPRRQEEAGANPVARPLGARPKHRAQKGGSRRVKTPASQSMLRPRPLGVQAATT